jgi:uracil-DNA glycosylase family 4
MLSREKFQDQYNAMADMQDLQVQVFSEGPLNASIAIIGEGPGETEVRKGSPFVGNSGNLLWNVLRPLGIHRANAYVTNVVKRQISLSRKGNERNIVHRDELDKWIGLCRWELEQLKDCRIVLCLGNYALEAVTNEVGIMNWRGSVLHNFALPNGQLGHVICTINPAYAQRELKMEPIFMMDCKKVKLVNEGKFKPYEIETIINPSYKEALDYIRSLKASREEIALDIESLNGETACIGLANNGHSAMCINWRDGSNNRFSPKEETEILLKLQDLCDSHGGVIAQNGQFDAYWLRLKDWLCINIQWDTLLAHHTLYPQLPHSLAFLVAQYTTHPFYKDEGRHWKEGGDIDQFWRYNCKDAALTWEVRHREQRELEQQGLYDFFTKHVMRATPHLISATVHGVAVDMEQKKRVAEATAFEVAKRQNRIYEIIHELTGDEDYRPNIGSWQQMQELYFRRLKLKGRGFSTDETNRTHMLKDPGTPPLAKELLTEINRWSEENKFLGTYANSRPDEDGRMRCEYKQSGTQKAPGRLSSSGLLTGTGQNLQNQPERAKEVFCADPGTVFGYFDLAQAEARIVAYRAKIETWKAQFEKARKDGKYDCHRALASEMFKVPYDDVPLKDWDADNRPTIRYTAKRCRHGLNYRMERYRLAEVTGLPYHEAARAFSIYHRITPELTKWWDQAERDFRQRREVFNALGRRLKVIQRIDDEVLASIVAFYPQSTLGDKVIQVWYQSEEDDEWPDDARICLNIHDALVCMASPKTIKTALKIMKKYAESPIMIQDAWHNKAEPLIIPADLKMSYPVSLDPKTGKFVEDAKGRHRWSHLKSVTL